MTITLNHTIVPSHDKAASAGFFARIMGLGDTAAAGPFMQVRVNGDLALDYDNRDSFDSHHYAFVVSDQEFEEIFERLKLENVGYGSGPFDPTDGKINTRRGGRGLYFADPDGHLMEIMTVAE
jgi:catechol 2,3-dioxygenase-like lactoylglutathione lyase family enzyme